MGQIAYAQNDTITVKGLVRVEEKGGLGYLMIANKRTNLGYFGSVNGRFTTRCLRKDTLMISVPGYAIKYICLRDSSKTKNVFGLDITLSRININMAAHEVKPLREYTEVQKDLRRLGPKIDPERIHTVAGALSSPITYLYQTFSRYERSKRKLAQLENEDKKIALMSELLKIYRQADMIDLEDSEFEPFIRHCRFSDHFLRNATQYEIILAVKGKYRTYVREDDRPGNY